MDLQSRPKNRARLGLLQEAAMAGDERSEDDVVAALWQAFFDEPMPVYGAPDIARVILAEHGLILPDRLVVTAG
jgi:hypothetical protein